MPFYRFKWKKWALKFWCPYSFLLEFLGSQGCHKSCSVCPSAATVSSYFVLSFAPADTFATFIHNPRYIHIDTVHLIHNSKNSHDVFIVRKFAQFHDAFYYCINFVLWEGSLLGQRATCGQQRATCTFFFLSPLSPLTRCLKTCVMLCKMFIACSNIVPLTRTVIISSYVCMLLKLLHTFAAVKIESWLSKFSKFCLYRHKWSECASNSLTLSLCYCNLNYCSCCVWQWELIHAYFYKKGTRLNISYSFCRFSPLFSFFPGNSYNGEVSFYSFE